MPTILGVLKIYKHDQFHAELSWGKVSQSNVILVVFFSFQGKLF